MRRGTTGTAIADKVGMASDSIDLKLRVVLVTTRAALRHSDGNREQRRAIVARGRELVEAIAADAEGHAGETIDTARSELDALETG